ncbi:hypothetical protein ACRAWF_42680 [Streptomyces sp. L7]
MKPTQHPAPRARRRLTRPLGAPDRLRRVPAAGVHHRHRRPGARRVPVRRGVGQHRLLQVSVHLRGGLPRQQRRLRQVLRALLLRHPLAQSCILVWNRPPGNLKTGWQYFYWDGTQWGVCRQLMGTQNPDGTWSGYANTTETSRMELTYDFGVYLALRGWLLRHQGRVHRLLRRHLVQGQRSHLVRTALHRAVACKDWRHHA